jgi:hypothetical protein
MPSVTVPAGAQKRDLGQRGISAEGSFLLKEKFPMKVLLAFYLEYVFVIVETISRNLDIF